MPYTRSIIPIPDAILTGWYWDYFLAAPYFNAGFTPQKLHRVGIVGLAAGTIAHQFTKVYTGLFLLMA